MSLYARGLGRDLWLIDSACLCFDVLLLKILQLIMARRNTDVSPESAFLQPPNPSFKHKLKMV